MTDWSKHLPGIVKGFRGQGFNIHEYGSGEGFSYVHHIDAIKDSVRIQISLPMNGGARVRVEIDNITFYTDRKWRTVELWDMAVPQLFTDKNMKQIRWFLSVYDRLALTHKDIQPTIGFANDNIYLSVVQSESESEIGPSPIHDTVYTIQFRAVTSSTGADYNILIINIKNKYGHNNWSLTESTDKRDIIRWLDMLDNEDVAVICKILDDSIDRFYKYRDKAIEGLKTADKFNREMFQIAIDRDTEKIDEDKRYRDELSSCASRT